MTGAADLVRDLARAGDPAVRAGEIDACERASVTVAPGPEGDDAYLRDLAEEAVRALELRLGRGEDPADAVRTVVGLVFAGGPDTGTIDRITAAVLDILGPAAG